MAPCVIKIINFSLFLSKQTSQNLSFWQWFFFRKEIFEWISIYNWFVPFQMVRFIRLENGWPFSNNCYLIAVRIYFFCHQLAIYKIKLIPALLVTLYAGVGRMVMIHSQEFYWCAEIWRKGIWLISRSTKHATIILCKINKWIYKRVLL